MAGHLIASLTHINVRNVAALVAQLTHLAAVVTIK